MDEAEQLAMLNADAAVARVRANAEPEKLNYWVDLIWSLARRMPEFSTNTVLEHGRADMRFREQRAMGAVVREAKKLGIIESTDRFEPDRTPGAHARPKRIWASKIYRP